MEKPARIEFAVASDIPNLIEIMNEVIAETRFNIEPFKWMRPDNNRVKYTIYIKDREDKAKVKCGLLEFTSTRNDRTQVTIKGLLEPVVPSQSQDHHLDRLFYLYMQRLVQLGIIDPTLPKPQPG